MPKTRAEVDAVWEPLHGKLTKLYYRDKKVSKDLFERAHAVIWLLHEKDSIQDAVLPDYQIEGTIKMRSQEIIELLAILKTADVDALIEELRKA